jgi:hypothetical protein
MSNTDQGASMDIDPPDATKPIDGRTREGRAAARAQQVGDDNGDYPTQRRHTRLPRQQPRAATRANTRREVEGRNGEMLSRRRIADGDPFSIPDDMKEPGWDYQWIAVSVLNDGEIVADKYLQMLENGWRPVPASRFPGRYMPVGKKGHIIRDGQGLYERPMSMTDEAKAEERHIAVAQMRDRDQALMGHKAGLRQAMTNGMAMDPQRYRGTGGRLQMSIDPALDVPAPDYAPADDTVA